MVTLSVAGMFKEVLTVLAGTMVFGDRLAVANVWGVLVTLGGIGWYNWIKIDKMRREGRDGEEGKEGYEMVGRNGQEEESEEEVFDVGNDEEGEGEQEHSRSL